MAPKYQMVADSLRTDILDGVYQKRMLLPTEQLLCQQFQVSRQTVRQALALLVSEGLIERRQGSGSHIRDRSKPAPMPHRSIAVITTYISDYIFPSILREVENVLSDHNSAPLLFATQNQVSNERKVLNTLLDLTSLDGVLVEGTKTGLPNPNLDVPASTRRANPVYTTLFSHLARFSHFKHSLSLSSAATRRFAPASSAPSSISL